MKTWMALALLTILVTVSASAGTLDNDASCDIKVCTIGPAGGVFVCPPGTALANGTTDLCTGTNINPKP